MSYAPKNIDHAAEFRKKYEAQVIGRRGARHYNTLRIRSSNNHLTEHRDTILRQLNKLDLHYLELTASDGYIAMEVDSRDLFEVVTELHNYGNWFGC